MLKPLCQHHALESSHAFQVALGNWFDKHGKDYPWRRTQDPYAILVSEVMLQQTQIATVLKKNYFSRFLEAFPDIASLALAEDEPLLKAWEGLGYYRRARMLRDTARAVIDVHAGNFPSDLGTLLKLPGIGKYTAGALRAFAFGLPAVLCDGNVMRVLSRVMDFSGAIDSRLGEIQLWDWATTLADDEHPRRHHAALMELGQSICRKGVPNCIDCPVATFCQTRSPELLPFKLKKITLTATEEHAVFSQAADGSVLLTQENGSRRQGLWRLPLLPSAPCGTLLHRFHYPITRYKVHFHIWKTTLTPIGECAWIPMDQLDTLAMTSPTRKALHALML